MNSLNFDEDYYERGVETHKSGYTDYHYMPERSYSEAVEIVRAFPDCNTILDFGSAKGFLVHTLRQLGKDAYGQDISEYAVKNSYFRATSYLKIIHPCIFKGFADKPHPLKKYDLVMAKDVLEHIPVENVRDVLAYLRESTEKYVFAVIPLGDNNLFRIREYEVDVTHVTKKDEDWWIDMFNYAGLKIVNFSYSMGAIKEKWTSVFPYGNGFFVLKRLNMNG